MIGPVLTVDAAVLETVGSVFDQAGAQLTALCPERLLFDAAVGLAQLATGRAYEEAVLLAVEQLTSHAEVVRAYALNLNAAAGRYQATDHSAAAAMQPRRTPDVV